MSEPKNQKKCIQDLKEKDHFHTHFHVIDKALGMDRNGKAYMSLQLSDASGAMNARVFERVDELAPLFQAGDFIKMKGFVQMFQGRLQLIGQDIQKAIPAEIQISELIRSAAGNLDDLRDRLAQTVTSLENEWIRTLLQKVLTDSEVANLLLKAPAAKSIHHAYLGGLLEHIMSIVDIMESLAKHYEFLNRDLLMFGAIFHDIGKIYELSFDSGIHYSDRGRLVGHMAIACEMIDETAREVAGFPESLKDVLKHIVLSHHGRLEYGSPKLPMLPEALVVAMIDDLDSKMNTISQFLKSEVKQLPAQEKWSRYHSGLERYFYLDLFRKA
jgi:3'-5' exoribonuclease